MVTLYMTQSPGQKGTTRLLKSINVASLLKVRKLWASISHTNSLFCFLFFITHAHVKTDKEKHVKKFALGRKSEGKLNMVVTRSRLQHMEHVQNKEGYRN